jgi:predicted Rossmann fold nucleotide-binding protein DprA/Smf involved in DNA uptake
MAKRAEPAQNGRDQTAHQRAIAIGQRFQSRMSAGAVELIVEGAMLVQHAVENIGRYPPCRETGHLSRSG